MRRSATKLALLVSTSLLSIGAVRAQDPSITPGSPRRCETFQPPYTKPTELPADSPLRKSLFDLLRPAVARDVKGTVRFEGSLRVFKNWAFFLGRTVDANGKRVRELALDDSDTVGLWLRTADGWRLVDHDVGSSDAFWLGWTEQYGAPAALIRGN